MKNSYLDYKIFVSPELSQISSTLSGDNKRFILIGYKDEQNTEMEAYLQKILSAAQLDLAHDCLVLKSTEGQPLPSFAQISHKNTIEKALLFGIFPNDLGLNINVPKGTNADPQYIPFEFRGCTFLFTDKLSDIQPSPHKRKDLWDSIRSLMGI